jgi:sec-independent protein translocase protein TatA
MLGNIGAFEYIVVMGLFILFFGSKRIPELFRGLNESIGEFRKGLKEEKQA